MSPGQFARLVLVMYFEQTAGHRIMDSLTEIKSELLERRVGQAILRERTAA